MKRNHAAAKRVEKISDHLRESQTGASAAVAEEVDFRTMEVEKEVIREVEKEVIKEVEVPVYIEREYGYEQEPPPRRRRPPTPPPAEPQLMPQQQLRCVMAVPTMQPCGVPHHYYCAPAAYHQQQLGGNGYAMPYARNATGGAVRVQPRATHPFYGPQRGPTPAVPWHSGWNVW